MHKFHCKMKQTEQADSSAGQLIIRKVAIVASSAFTRKHIQYFESVDDYFKTDILIGILFFLVWFRHILVFEQQLINKNKFRTNLKKEIKNGRKGMDDLN